MKYLGIKIKKEIMSGTSTRREYAGDYSQHDYEYELYSCQIGNKKYRSSSLGYIKDEIYIYFNKENMKKDLKKVQELIKKVKTLKKEINKIDDQNRMLLKFDTEF